MINDQLAALPIFPHFNIALDVIHSSIDGQKYGTQRNTIRSRYSPKYFGLEKGLSCLTLVANNAGINSRLIGANEHESHFTFDLLKNNTSSIISDVNSTDAHGKNQVNHIFLTVFGFQHAPRISDVLGAIKNLVGTKPLHRYDIGLIEPATRESEIILEQWETLQRIFLSLGLKTTNQSNIVRKLSSSKRHSKTKDALRELDAMVNSLYTLDYIDRPELRRGLQKALNRGEAFHRIKKALFYYHFGKFRVKTELEQEIWSDCCRLMANCINYYNACILSDLLEKVSDSTTIDYLTSISPIAWQHINIYGKHEFPRSGNWSLEKLFDNISLEHVLNKDFTDARDL